MTAVLTIELHIKQADEFTNAALLLFRNWLMSPASTNLHTGVELYLKTFILSSGSRPKYGHDLEILYNRCVKLDPHIASDSTLQAIRWVNVFGAYDGGTRYLRRMDGGYAIPMNIFEQLEPLIDYIKTNVDLSLDVTDKYPKL